MKRRKKEPKQVACFRLPEHQKKFLKKKAGETEKSMSMVLVDYIDRIIAYEEQEARLPKAPRKKS